MLKSETLHNRQNRSMTNKIKAPHLAWLLSHDVTFSRSLWDRSNKGLRHLKPDLGRFDVPKSKSVTSTLSSVAHWPWRSLSLQKSDARAVRSSLHKHSSAGKVLCQLSVSYYCCLLRWTFRCPFCGNKGTKD